MKKSYVSMFVFVSLILLCGIVFTDFALADVEIRKNIKVDLKNAVQHIQSVYFVDSGSSENDKAIMSSSDHKVKIYTNNFVIASEDEQSAAITGSVLSSVLGGVENQIFNSTGSSIVGGSGNKLDSNYAIIVGGAGNRIKRGSDYSVIAGGNKNTIQGQNSVIAGGEENIIIGNYSAVVGFNSTVSGDYSVALGSGAKVNANNSFLWTDGESDLDSVSADNVFAVISKSGMVVNTTEAHNLAQLTIGGSLTVAGSGGVICSPDTKGSLRLVDKKEGGQQCLCSCNGEGWDSILGDGECVARCQDMDNLTPHGGTGLRLTGSDGREFYIGSCDQGEVVSGSFYMNASGMNWACQERDGTVVNNLHSMGCTGNIPDNAVVNPLFPKLDSITFNWNYHYSNTGDLCSFSCAGGYVRNESTKKCIEVCTSSYGCVPGYDYTKNPGYDSYDLTGSYTCSGANDVVICNVDCNEDGKNDKVWNGKTCRPKLDSYCTGRYACLDDGILKVNNPQNLMDKHTRNCVNSRQIQIGKACEQKKNLHNVVLTGTVTRVATGNTIGHAISFKLSEKLPETLSINLPWTESVIPTKNGNSTFKIVTGNLNSDSSQYFESDLITFGTAVANPSRMSTENDYYEISVKKSENFVCYGEIPEGAKLNTNKTPSSNMKYRYSVNSNDACSFTTCNNGYHLDVNAKVCCPGTNSNDPNTYAIFTGGKCRTADHWEWRFNQTSLTTTSGKEILGAFFTQSSPSSFTKDTTVSWNSNLSQILRNIAGRHNMNSFVTPYTINGNKITVTLTNFYTGGLPVMGGTQRPSYTLTVTGNLTTDILNLTFDGNQPTVTRMYSSTGHTTKTFYGCIIARGDSVSGTSHKGTVSLSCPWTISATATPIYTKDCEAKTVPGGKISTYGYYFYHVSPIDHGKTLKVESVGAHKCTYTFSCNNGQLSPINVNNEQC